MLDVLRPATAAEPRMSTPDTPTAVVCKWVLSNMRRQYKRLVASVGVPCIRVRSLMSAPRAGKSVWLRLGVTEVTPVTQEMAFLAISSYGPENQAEREFTHHAQQAPGTPSGPSA